MTKTNATQLRRCSRSAATLRSLHNPTPSILLDLTPDDGQPYDNTIVSSQISLEPPTPQIIECLRSLSTSTSSLNLPENNDNKNCKSLQTEKSSTMGNGTRNFLHPLDQRSDQQDSTGACPHPPSQVSKESVSRKLSTVTAAVSRKLLDTQESLRKMGLTQVLYITGLVLFTLAGGLMFKYLDFEAGQATIDIYKNRCLAVIQRAQFQLIQECGNQTLNVCQHEIATALSAVDNCHKRCTENCTKVPSLPMSDLGNAIIFASTTYTTIGYGNIYPTTRACQVATIVYTLIGIPYFLALLQAIGRWLRIMFIRLWNWFRRLLARKICKLSKVANKYWAGLDAVNLSQDHHHQNWFPFFLGCFVSMAYLCLEAWILQIMLPPGELNFFECFYFVVQSVTLVGFGDVMPSNFKFVLYHAGMLLCGTFLMSMCFFILQESVMKEATAATDKVSRSVQVLSRKVSRDIVAPFNSRISGMSLRRNFSLYSRSEVHLNGGQSNRHFKSLGRSRKRSQSLYLSNIHGDVSDLFTVRRVGERGTLFHDSLTLKRRRRLRENSLPSATDSNLDTPKMNAMSNGKSFSRLIEGSSSVGDSTPMSLTSEGSQSRTVSFKDNEMTLNDVPDIKNFENGEYLQESCHKSVPTSARRRRRRWRMSKHQPSPATPSGESDSCEPLSSTSIPPTSNRPLMTESKKDRKSWRNKWLYHKADFGDTLDGNLSDCNHDEIANITITNTIINAFNNDDDFLDQILTDRTSLIGHSPSLMDSKSTNQDLSFGESPVSDYKTRSSPKDCVDITAGSNSRLINETSTSHNSNSSDQHQSLAVAEYSHINNGNNEENEQPIVLEDRISSELTASRPTSLNLTISTNLLSTEFAISSQSCSVPTTEIQTRLENWDETFL